MRLFIAALAFGLTAAASAAPLQITPALLHAAPPPLHTPAANALAVQKLLHLQTIPTLGQSVSVNPAVPYVPGLAELDFGNAVLYTGGTMSLLGGSTPMVLIDFENSSFLHNGWIKLTISGHAGSHYAIDCTVNSVAVPTQYQIGGAISASGSVEVGADKHLVFATPALPANGNLYVTLKQAPPNMMGLYGCEISPF